MYKILTFVKFERDIMMLSSITLFLGGGGVGVESDFGGQCYTQFSLKRQQKHFGIAIKNKKIKKIWGTTNLNLIKLIITEEMFKAKVLNYISLKPKACRISC